MPPIRASRVRERAMRLMGPSPCFAVRARIVPCPGAARLARAAGIPGDIALGPGTLLGGLRDRIARQRQLGRARRRAGSAGRSRSPGRSRRRARRCGRRISSVSTYSATVVSRHAARQLRDRLHHRLGARVLEHVAHEAAVDLEHGRPAARAGTPARTARCRSHPARSPQPSARRRRMSASAWRRFAMVALSVSSKQNSSGFRPLLGDALAQEVGEGSSLSDWPEKLIANTSALPLEQLGVRLERLDDVVDHPAIDHRHQLVAVRGRQEAVRADGLAVLVDHAQQQLEVRARALGGGERQDQLRVQVQAAVGRWPRAGCAAMPMSAKRRTMLSSLPGRARRGCGRGPWRPCRRSRRRRARARAPRAVGSMARDADADRRPAACLADCMAPSCSAPSRSDFGEGSPRRRDRAGSSTAKRSPEMRAPSAPGRQALADQLAELRRAPRRRRACRSCR